MSDHQRWVCKCGSTNPMRWSMWCYFCAGPAPENVLKACEREAVKVALIHGVVALVIAVAVATAIYFMAKS